MRKDPPSEKRGYLFSYKGGSRVKQVGNEKKGSWWIDVILFIILFAVLYGFIQAGSGMVAPFAAKQIASIDLNPTYLPYYALRSLLRMFIALICSLIFTFIYAKVAASSKTAER